MNQRLTSIEIDTLIEAMDSWVNKDLSWQLMGGILDAMLTDRKAPGAEDEFVRRQQRKQSEADTARKQREELACILKDKLFAMRRDVQSSESLPDAVRR